MFLFSRFILSDSVNMILSIPQFEIVRYAQLVTRQECRDLLPGDAGVYAWFRDLTLSEEVIASEAQFVDALMALFDESSLNTRPLSARRKGRVSPFYDVGIVVTPGTLTSTKKEALTHYAKTESLRREIGRALEALTFWQPPLYVGKTENLAERVWEHVNRRSDLGDLLEEAGLSLEQCLVAYVPISDTADGTTPLVQLVEDIMTRLSLPGFVRRVG